MENVQKVEEGKDWYLVFVFLRLVAVFVSLSYLHPDGFFQAPEVIAEGI
jgi:hypothetical protein